MPDYTYPRALQYVKRNHTQVIVSPCSIVVSNSQIVAKYGPWYVGTVGLISNLVIASRQTREECMEFVRENELELATGE